MVMDIFREYISSLDTTTTTTTTHTKHQPACCCEKEYSSLLTCIQNLIILVNYFFQQVLGHLYLFLNYTLISWYEFKGDVLYTRPCQGAGEGPMSPVWISKRLVLVFINACCLLSALPSLSQFGRGTLSLVAISFYDLSLLFGPCRLSEFTLAGPHIS